MNRILIGFAVVFFAATITKYAAAQERLKSYYASVGATNANPASQLTVDDIVDDAVVRAIERDGLIERLYR